MKIKLYEISPITQILSHAQQAAEAAEAAAVQGKFWDIHDILYENQQALDYYHLVEYVSMLVRLHFL